MVIERNSDFVQEIPEHLIKKTEQNRILGLSLARWSVVARYIGEAGDLDCVRKLVEWSENNMMVINGKSRRDFIEGMKAHYKIREEEKGG